MSTQSIFAPRSGRGVGGSFQQDLAQAVAVVWSEVRQDCQPLAARRGVEDGAAANHLRQRRLFAGGRHLRLSGSG
jgi:hypothetical protein